MVKSMALALAGLLALCAGGCNHQHVPTAVGGGPQVYGYGNGGPSEWGESTAISNDMTTGEHGAAHHRVKVDNGQGVVIGTGVGSSSSSGDDVFGY